MLENDKTKKNSRKPKGKEQGETMNICTCYFHKMYFNAFALYASTKKVALIKQPLSV